MEDWLKIKTEYITTDISYRKLAEKYSISKNRIADRGRDEGWPEMRVQFRDKTVTKSLEKISEKKAKKAARVEDLADKLLIKLEQAIEEIDQTMVTHKTKTKDIQYGDLSAPGKPTKEVIHEEEQLLAVTGVVDRIGLRQLTAALRDLKEVKGILSDMERREREARIEVLRRQAEKGDTSDSSVTVQLEGVEEYAL